MKYSDIGHCQIKHSYFHSSFNFWQHPLLPEHGGRVQHPKMFTFARLRRLVLRTSAESWSAPPGPAWWGKGAPPGSPLGDDLSFFFTSIGPAAEADGPVWASETWTLSAPAAPAEDEEEEEEEPASDFLLDSIMEDVGGLSWQRGNRNEMKPIKMKHTTAQVTILFFFLSEMVEI